jgi:hypothetical protein
MTAYYFHQKQLIRTFEGRTNATWTIFEAPTEELRAAITWNDANGDFENLDRGQILEVFINDFIRG